MALMMHNIKTKSLIFSKVHDYAVIIPRNLSGLHVSSKVIKTPYKDLHCETLNKVYYIHINSACMYCLKPMNIVHCK